MWLLWLWPGYARLSADFKVFLCGYKTVLLHAPHLSPNPKHVRSSLAPDPSYKLASFQICHSASYDLYYTLLLFRQSGTVTPFKTKDLPYCSVSNSFHGNL